MIGRTYGSMYFLAAKVSKKGKNLALLIITLTVDLYYL